MYYLFILFICLSFIYYKYNLVMDHTLHDNRYSICTNIKDTPQYIFGLIFERILKHKYDSIIDFSQHYQHYQHKLEILDNNKIQFITVNENLIEPHHYQNIRFVCGLYYNYIHFIIDKLPNVNKIEDLRNKTIGVENKESLDILQNILKAYNFSLIKDGESPKENSIFYYLHINLNNIMNDFYEGNIDGVFLIRPNNDIYIKNIVQKKKVKFMNLLLDPKKENIDRFVSRNLDTRYYYTNPFNSSIIQTLAVRTLFLTNDKVSENIVYFLLKTIRENIGNILVQITNQTSNLENKYQGGTKDTLVIDSKLIEMSYSSIKIHKGAMKFYKNKEIITEIEPDTRFIKNTNMGLVPFDILSQKSIYQNLDSNYSSSSESISLSS